MKTLLIDDDSFALKLLIGQLALLGHTNVMAFDRADAALALVEATPDAVALIFCDLQMPDMDGIELVRQLARVGYTGGLVLLSGEDERVLKTAGKLAKARMLQMIGAFRKPVSLQALRGVLKRNAMLTTPASRLSRKTYAPDELKRAIADGQFVNHYQPKVDIASGAVVGVEALVRWQHPVDGLVYPDQFVPTAEDHGQIDDLTRAVLVNALRQTRLWRDAGIEWRVAVNISMDNLANLDFPDWVAEATGDAGVPLSSLVLEVTESRLMTDPVAALDTLSRLRLKRVGLSIDDFGIGHSSLALLRDLPFDELKIDQSFVHGAWRDASLKAIFDGSLAMAMQLGMTSVAEGVEDCEDWAFLRVTGCDVAQGYFIGKPMPQAALPSWLDDWRERCSTLLKATAP